MILSSGTALGTWKSRLQVRLEHLGKFRESALLHGSRRDYGSLTMVRSPVRQRSVRAIGHAAFDHSPVPQVAAPNPPVFYQGNQYAIQWSRHQTHPIRAKFHATALRSGCPAKGEGKCMPFRPPPHMSFIQGFIGAGLRDERLWLPQQQSKQRSGIPLFA
ncbi:hypothetical protein BC826DRAFT_445086 [Russula brevipes]|nr:hypothetical protein BC826DRAFT_445086 [Russula brevipes]